MIAWHVIGAVSTAAGILCLGQAGRLAGEGDKAGAVRMALVSVVHLAVVGVVMVSS